MRFCYTPLKRREQVADRAIGIVEKIFDTNSKEEITNRSKELEALSKTELIAQLLHAEVVHKL